MSFEEIEITLANGLVQHHIVVDLGDGAYKSFPVDELNPEYVAWLASQNEESN